MSVLNLKHPRFQVSIGGVLSAVLLVNALQAFVVGIHEPLRFGVAALVNYLIKRGHYDVLFLPQKEIVWPLMYSNLLISIICLVIGLGLASRIYGGKKPQKQLFK